MPTLSLSQTFQWNVLNNYQLARAFAWKVGDKPLYWYRVESKTFPSACYRLCEARCCVGQPIFAAEAMRLARAGTPDLKRVPKAPMLKPGMAAKPHYKVRSVPDDLNGTYRPDEICGVYGFPHKDLCQDPIIAILELGGGYYEVDVRAAFAQMGLPTPVINNLSVDGANNSPGNQDIDTEVALDIQVAGAAYSYCTCRAANILMVWAPNTNKGFADAITAAAKSGASVLSISWGSPENSWSQSDLSAMETAFKLCIQNGCVPFAASGDDGATDGTSGLVVDYPASSPEVTGCGGTTLQPPFETGWSGSGGGFSDAFSKPIYQNCCVPGSKRGVPDVAGDADPNSGYQIMLYGTTIVVGGTSAVAPLWAGLTAAVSTPNQRQSSSSPSPWNDYLYNSQRKCWFNDITVGNNGGYSCTAGWDAVTGLGSPRLSTQCFTELHNVLAYSTKHLAKQLKVQRFNKSIKSIYRWIRPALECDIKNEEALGINQNCPTFVDVDKCIPELYEFIDCGDCPLLDPDLKQAPSSCGGSPPADPCLPTNPFYWYTQYDNIQPGSLSQGQTVIVGQVIGTVLPSLSSYPAYLDFTVRDCLSRSVDVDTKYYIERFGAKGGSPIATVFDTNQRAYVLEHTVWPVDPDWCDWVELRNSSLTGSNYYTVRWVSDLNNVIDGGPPRPADLALVFCAGGGTDVLTTVYSIGSTSVTLKHTRLEPMCCSRNLGPGGLTLGGPPNWWSPTPSFLLPMNDLVNTPLSGWLPMMLGLEISLPQFKKGKLSYSASSDAWLYQWHEGDLRGVCEFGCRTRMETASWSFKLNVTKGQKRTSFQVVFFPDNFRRLRDFTCEFTIKDKAVKADVPTQTVSLRDDLGLFRKPVKFVIRG